MADFECFSAFSIRYFSAPDFAQQEEEHKRILGLYLFQILRDAFTININLVSDERLREVESRKIGFRNKQQTRVYRDLSW